MGESHESSSKWGKVEQLSPLRWSSHDISEGIGRREGMIPNVDAVHR